MFTRKLSFTPITYPKARAMGITEFPYYEYDSNGYHTYWENSDGEWVVRELTANGKEISFKRYDGYWSKGEFDADGNRTYYENSKGEIKRY